MDFEVKQDVGKNKFFAVIDGKEAHLDYEIINDEVIEFPYTYVSPTLRGKGVAAKILEFGLNYAREKNLSVIPSCSYVESYINKNKKYQDLLKKS